MKYQPTTIGQNGFNNSGTTCANAVDFDANITIGQGDHPLCGQFTQITLVSGAVVAYHD